MLRTFSLALGAVLFLSTTACTPSQGNIPPVSDAAAAPAVDAATANTAKIAAVSQAVVTGIAAVKAGAIAAGADSATLAQIGTDQALAQSGKDNVAALAANDAAGTSPTDSTSWELSLLKEAVQVAGVVLPLVL